MAHSCPECGEVCYCGGDFDDLLLDDTEYQEECIHCLGVFDPDEPEDWDDVPLEGEYEDDDATD